MSKTLITEKLPTSKTAKRMIRRVSPIYSKSYVAKNLFQVMGDEWDDVWKFLQLVREQGFACTCTWGFGIDAWEDRYSIKHNYDLDLQTRRDNIRIKRTRRMPLNPKVFEDMAKDLSKIEIDVDETVDYGVIGVGFDVDNDLSLLPYMFRELKKIKPSHLTMKAISAVNHNIQLKHVLDGYHLAVLDEKVWETPSAAHAFGAKHVTDFVQEYKLVPNRLNSKHRLNGKIILSNGKIERLITHNVDGKHVAVFVQRGKFIPNRLNSEYMVNGDIALSGGTQEKTVEHTGSITLKKYPTRLNSFQKLNSNVSLTDKVYDIGRYGL